MQFSILKITIIINEIVKIEGLKINVNLKDQIDKIINEIEKNEMLKNIIITDQTVDKIHINIIIDNVKNVINLVAWYLKISSISLKFLIAWWFTGTYHVFSYEFKIE